jgi:aminopeptidase N
MSVRPFRPGRGRIRTKPGRSRTARAALLAALLAAAAAQAGVRDKREMPARSDADPDLIRGYDALAYRLDLDFPLLSARFDGVMTLTARSLRDNLASMAVHAGYLDIRAVEIDGAPAPWEQRSGNLLAVVLPGRPSAGDTFTVRIRYEAEPEYAGFFRNDTCAYTMSEPSSARYWFPCKDVPWDKATAEIAATVPRGVEVASVGRLIGRVPGDGTETFTWKTDLPVAPYLMCVTMSPHYAVWTDRYPTTDGDSIDCMNYVLRPDSAKAVADFANLPAAMAFFSGLFGRYPFEKYGMAEVTRDFSYGGMEHQTMTTVNALWFKGNRGSEDGFVHEMAHSWWGDAVTLDDWPDIWLNEGFATYCEALFRERMGGRAAYRSEIDGQRETYFVQAGKRDFPVYDPPDGELFNWGIEYCKGSLILHMLRGVTGDDAFFGALRSYFAAHRYGNASRRDFQSAVEAASGMDLEWFFAEWLDSAGYPTLRYDWGAERPADGDAADPAWDLVLDVRQAPSGGTFEMPVGLRATGEGAAFADTVIWVLGGAERFRWRLSFRPDSLAWDPEGWVVMKTGRTPVSADSEAGASGPFSLRPNFPNPFGESTSIEVEFGQDAPSEASAGLRVYNLLGERVRSLGTVRRENAPLRTVEWDGTDDSGRRLPSGIYIVRLEGEGLRLERKVVLRR